MSTPSTPSTPPTSAAPSTPPEPESAATEAADAATGAPSAQGSDAAPAPAKSRYSMGTLPNMLRSMLVIGLFVLALVAIVPRITSVQRPAVDAAGKAGQVAAQTTWPIQLPKGLGEGWVSTVATYAPGTEGVPTFTTVWATPSGKDIALKQAVGVPDGWVRRSVNDGAPSGSVQVSGRAFERFVARDAGQIAYVARGAGAKGLTLVASGTAPEDELKSFVAALAPVSPAPGVSPAPPPTS
ncbi:DUF4245 domain-containing protein [Terrabacter sp. 2RAF25]|uniref:DUF4245 domain-containing protein n=1 Tax=Terrabacter sp. 2RAF25 TaxID=3232998 RepID=UPI003F98FA3E